MSQLTLGNDQFRLPPCTLRVRPSNAAAWDIEIFTEGEGDRVSLIGVLPRIEGEITAQALHQARLEIARADSADGIELKALPECIIAPWNETAHLRFENGQLTLEYAGVFQRLEVSPLVELKDSERYLEGTLSIECELKLDAQAHVAVPMTVAVRPWWKFW